MRGINISKLDLNSDMRGIDAPNKLRRAHRQSRLHALKLRGLNADSNESKQQVHVLVFYCYEGEGLSPSEIITGP